MSKNSPQPAPAPVFSFCTVHSHLDTHTTRVDVGSFFELYQHLKKFTKLIPITREAFDALEEGEQKRLKNAPCVIFATFTDWTVRTDAAVEHCTALGLDVDEAHVELDQLKQLLGGYEAIIYESVRSTPDFRRWRVIVKYAQPLTPELHAVAFNHWRMIIPGVAASVNNPARVWYVPTRLKGDDGRIIEHISGASYAPLLAGGGSTRSPAQILLERIPPPADAPAKAGNRNNQLAAYAASITRHCASLDELVGGLTAKNAEYSPPLPAKEVQAVARGAWRKRVKLGWIESKPQAAQEAAAEGFGCDGADLFATNPGPVPWLVSDLMTYGAHLLVGRPKGGKSWVTLDLAYACANGGTFAGRQALRTRVLWIAGEDTTASLARRLHVRGEALPRGMVVVCTGDTLRAEREQWEACSFDAWLKSYLIENPDVGLVIIDTQSSCEAIWQGEQAKKKPGSATEDAYQMVRLYEDVGQATQTCIVMVHHMGKMKHNKGTDYHERVNLPATVVAGVSASMVLADHPERDIHDEDDHRRVLAVRGRHLAQGDETLMVELKQGHMALLGKYTEIAQSEAQAETLAALEALLEEATPDERGERWVTYKQLAAQLGRAVVTISQRFQTMKKNPLKLMWKGRKVVLKQSKGVRLV